MQQAIRSSNEVVEINNHPQNSQPQDEKGPHSSIR
ncbi:hypothetical protein PSPO01_16273 [Paraphaeosphaeria sporulosa]